MDIKLIVVGKVKEEYYRNLIKHYKLKFNLTSHTTLRIIELPDESIPKNASDSEIEKIKQKEGERILEQIDKKDYVIAFCVEGRITDSYRFGAEFIYPLIEEGYKDFSVVIGGSLGLSDEVKKRADYKMSFSRMTYPHQLTRVLFMDMLNQVYL